MIITLTTDFGYKDVFAGAMKGVIYGINPDVRVVDVSHGITRHSVMEAALRLHEFFGYFPRGTIHVVVVDPGVGSPRRPILLECDDHLFLGPDNGVFSKVIWESRETVSVRHITSSHYFIEPRGSTFHGRDVFAPVAAWLSKGTRIDSLGDTIEDFVRLDLPEPRVEGGQATGEVIYSDGFGNAVTNITAADIEMVRETKPGAPVRVFLKGGQTDMKDYFEQGNDRRPHGIINSSGYLEIFLYQGDVTAFLKLRTGEPVSVRAV
ncbi:MAG: SAM-dependent chlorinase/fluorinase [Nitrospirota bacterium]|jgi:S-adenosylmethionine hydrolase